MFLFFNLLTIKLMNLKKQQAFCSDASASLCLDIFPDKLNLQAQFTEGRRGSISAIVQPKAIPR